MTNISVFGLKFVGRVLVAHEHDVIGANRERVKAGPYQVNGHDQGTGW